MPHHANVDFLIIGAQKSGTTSVFKYLSAHPQIYMPECKETRFFSHDFERGVDWYLSTYFEKAPVTSVKGEASPHYMCSKSVPERIANAFPGIKLIALLRNPVSRAFSHYQMTVRRGREKRPFLQAIQHDATSIKDRVDLDEDFGYVGLGEYGSILAQFFSFFPRDQILVDFMEDLEKDPIGFVNRLYGFLGVDDHFLPKNIGHKFHTGGRQRIPGLTQSMSRRLAWLRQVRWIRRYLTEERIASVLFRVETQWNIKTGCSEAIPSDAREYLRNHYQHDVLQLESLLGRAVPWAEFYSTRN